METNCTIADMEPHGAQATNGDVVKRNERTTDKKVSLAHKPLAGAMSPVLMMVLPCVLVSSTHTYCGTCALEDIHASPQHYVLALWC